MRTRFEMNGVLYVPLCNLTTELKETLEFNGYQIIKVENGPGEQDLR